MEEMKNKPALIQIHEMIEECRSLAEQEKLPELFLKLAIIDKLLKAALNGIAEIREGANMMAIGKYLEEMEEANGDGK